MPGGGSAWRSSIEAPHFHTDRDVGAASIGEGLLAAFAVTRDRRYLRAARAAGDFLLGVAEPAAGGLRWPDWADPDGRRSDDALHELRRRRRRDQRLPLEAVRGHARVAFSRRCPRRYALAGGAGARPILPGDRLLVALDGRSRRSVAYYGVGMGQAGIVLALDAFADRTGDPSFRAYARAGAAQLRQLTADGKRPLPRSSDENATHETGFLSGSAGAAYMFLERYRRDRDPVDLATARRLLAWVDDQAVVDQAGAVSWPFAGQAGAWTASGFELGVAGIAWVELQASRTTGDAAYRARARQAGSWLRRAAVRGGAWEDCPAIQAHRCTSGSTAAPQGSAGCSRTGPRGHRPGREPRRRALGARRTPRRGSPRPPRRVLVREPDRRPSTSARRALLALGLRRHRRVRRAARRLVRADARRAARRLTLRAGPDKIGGGCARMRQPRRCASSRFTRPRARA